MLVLSRRQNEEIVFPELGITVKVIRVKGNQVRLGVTAPEAVRVLRSELAFEPDTRETKNLPAIFPSQTTAAPPPRTRIA